MTLTDDTSSTHQAFINVDQQALVSQPKYFNIYSTKML